MGGSATTAARCALALSLALWATAPIACQDDLDLDTRRYGCAQKEHCAPGYVCDLRDCRCKSESDSEEPPHLEPVPGKDCEVIRHYRWGADYGPADPGGGEP